MDFRPFRRRFGCAFSAQTVISNRANCKPVVRAHAFEVSTESNGRANCWTVSFVTARHSSPKVPHRALRFSVVVPKPFEPWALRRITVHGCARILNSPLKLPNHLAALNRAALFGLVNALVSNSKRWTMSRLKYHRVWRSPFALGQISHGESCSLVRSALLQMSVALRT